MASRRPEITGARDPSLAGFLRRQGISRSTWNGWRKKGLTPRYTQPAGPHGKIIISEPDEMAWMAAHIAQAAE
jgi:hypothetical protein